MYFHRSRLRILHDNTNGINVDTLTGNRSSVPMLLLTDLFIDFNGTQVYGVFHSSLILIFYTELLSFK